jgi:hypothetical protein
MSNGLPVRFRQSSVAAEGGEVQLAERMSAIDEVSHDPGHERATTPAGDASSGVLESRYRNEPLLHRDAEEQCSLPVGHCPVRGSDRRHFRPGARNAGGDHVSPVPAPHLMNANAGKGQRPTRMPDGHVNLTRIEIASTRSDERRHAVQGDDPRSKVDHRSPPLGQIGQFAGVHANRLPTENSPAARCHHVAHRETV